MAKGDETPRTNPAVIENLLDQILDYGQIGLAAASPGGRRQFAHLRKARRRKQSQASKDAHQCFAH